MQMPYYDRINVSEVIDVNVTTASTECIICHFRLFLDHEFKFQSTVCNRCHNVLMIINVLIYSNDIKNIDVLNIHGADYCCLILIN